MESSRATGVCRERRVNDDAGFISSAQFNGDWFSSVTSVWSLCSKIGGAEGRAIWCQWESSVRQSVADGRAKVGGVGERSFDALVSAVKSDSYGCERAVGTVDDGGFESSWSDRTGVDLRGRSIGGCEGARSVLGVVRSRSCQASVAGSRVSVTDISSSVATSVAKEIGKESEVVSQKTLFNRERRVKRKQRKLRRQAAESESGIPEWRRNAKPVVSEYRGAFSFCDDETRAKLADTRAKRLIAENEACVRKAQAESDRWVESQKLQRKRENLQMLKVGKQIEALRSSGVETIQEDLEQRRLSQQLKIVQTRQKLELISAQDIESLKRCQASKVLKDTETNKVAVERAYGALSGTDNLPSLVGGKVFTVKSGSISPNSSASEAEVRAIQKKNLDLEKQVEELTAKLARFETGNAERQDYDGYDYSEGVTIDEDGHPIGDFGDYSGYIGKDNRFHFGESMMPYFD